MRWSLIDRWPVNKGLIAAIHDLIRGELDKLPSDAADNAVILFSAHSLPLQVSCIRGVFSPLATCPFVSPLLHLHSCRAVHSPFSTCFLCSNCRAGCLSGGLILFKTGLITPRTQVRRSPTQQRRAPCALSNALSIYRAMYSRSRYCIAARFITVDRIIYIWNVRASSWPRLFQTVRSCPRRLFFHNNMHSMRNNTQVVPPELTAPGR